MWLRPYFIRKHVVHELRFTVSTGLMACFQPPPHHPRGWAWSLDARVSLRRTPPHNFPNSLRAPPARALRPRARRQHVFLARLKPPCSVRRCSRGYSGGSVRSGSAALGPVMAAMLRPWAAHWVAAVLLCRAVAQYSSDQCSWRGR